MGRRSVNLLRSAISPAMDISVRGVTVAGALVADSTATLNGALTRLTPESLVDWNYTLCAAPVVSQAPTLGDGAGVQADQTATGILWPNADGGFKASTMTAITAQTTSTMFPQMEGVPIATDVGSSAIGFNFQLDAETTTNSGMQLHWGAMAKGSNANKFVVGTHAGTIDVTFWTTDWTDYDCVVAGWRKEEAIQTGFNAAIAAETGDPGYSDMFVCGVMGATRQVQSAGGINGDTTMQVVDTTDAAVDADNLRFKMALSEAGVATLTGLVNNAEAGAGTLAEATAGSHTITFDEGDVLVPFIATFKNGAADVEILIKDLTITRTPGISTAKL